MQGRARRPATHERAAGPGPAPTMSRGLPQLALERQRSGREPRGGNSPNFDHANERIGDRETNCREKPVIRGWEDGGGRKNLMIRTNSFKKKGGKSVGATMAFRRADLQEAFSCRARTRFASTATARPTRSRRCCGRATSRWPVACCARPEFAVSGHI